MVSCLLLSVVLYLIGHGFGKLHPVNPSLCLLVLFSLVFKFSFLPFPFFLCTPRLFCAPLHKIALFIQIFLTYLKKKKSRDQNGIFIKKKKKKKTETIVDNFFHTSYMVFSTNWTWPVHQGNVHHSFM